MTATEASAASATGATGATVIVPTEAGETAAVRAVRAGRVLVAPVRAATATGTEDEAYRRYSWNVRDVDDLALAPFQLLAGEGRSYVDRDHLWHMTTVGRFAQK